MFDVVTSYAIMTVVAILVCAIHEYSKALIASGLGDPTPKNKGRLTINPIKHIEPIGLILMVFFYVGWGNPCPVNPSYFKNRRSGVLLTYIFPSAVNLIIGLTTAALINFIPQTANADLNHYIQWTLVFFACFNVYMALFNIIPVNPLDGARVLSVLLHPNAVVKMQSYEKILQIVLIFALIFGLHQTLILTPGNYLIDNVLFTTLVKQNPLFAVFVFGA